MQNITIKVYFHALVFWPSEKHMSSDMGYNKPIDGNVTK